ncbi:CII family transcriptional regulator [Enterobacter kobei]|uniref:CII family transcriptional regulator n=1 Tax=Enterobacter kobei TaxID=208224 RepID=UPI002E2B046D|nr:CII family transcriptional regulator [Enterobacter kobei]MED5770276.1 CII family transcriptional regulator [Enterobacter kobei]
MENTTTRNKAQARKIESWILNQIAMKGASNVAKAIGMDKSGITRWKENMLPSHPVLRRLLSTQPDTRGFGPIFFERLHESNNRYRPGRCPRWGQRDIPQPVIPRHVSYWLAGTDC